MNVDTGEILRLKSLLADAETIPEGFKIVPDDLSGEAEKELGDKDRTVVDMTKDTPLVNWAKNQRVIKSKKRSNLPKMQKQSKRRNRNE